LKRVFTNYYYVKSQIFVYGDESMNTEIIGNKVRITRPVQIVELSLEEYLEGKYKLTTDALTPRSKMLIGRITTYIDAMKSGVPVNQADAIKNQTIFLQTMQGILESNSKDAQLCWDVLLFLANKHSHDLFNERLACRYYNGLPDAAQHRFLALMSLVVATANIRNRVKALRDYPIEAVLKRLPTEKQKLNLSAYYASNI
jgi:hypothetical protein